MKITLISDETYDRLKHIHTKLPNLSFQNIGYQYIDKSKLSSEDIEAFKEVESILKNHIERFSKFHNFKLDKEGNIQLRFDYGYDESFTGVGYILLDELLNGFND